MGDTETTSVLGGDPTEDVVQGMVVRNPFDAMNPLHILSPLQTKHLFEALNGFSAMDDSAFGSRSGFDPLYGIDRMHGSGPMDGLKHISSPSPVDASAAPGIAVSVGLGSAAHTASALDLTDTLDVLEVEAVGAVHATGRTNIPGAPQPPTRDTKSEWLIHRDTITRLYKDEDRTLEDVMKIMCRKYKFYATDNAYKKKLKTWRVTKNFRAVEVLAMLHTKRSREAVGKRSRFTIRGHVVDPRKMDTYLKRNPSIMQRFAKGKGMAAPLASFDITCRTPSPEPSAGLRGAERNRAVEELLYWIRNYVDGSFRSGAWFLDDTGNCHARKSGTAGRLLDRAVSRLETLWRIAVSDRADLVTILGPVFKSLEAILKAEHFRTRSSLFDWVMLLHQSEHRQVAQMILGYLANLSLRIFERQHPVPQIWRCIKDLSDLDNVDIMEKLHFVEIDAMQAHAGEATAAVNTLYRQCSAIMGNIGEYHRVESRLAHIFESRPHDSYDSTKADLRLRQSQYRIFSACREGRFAQAWEELAAVLDLARRWDPPWEFYHSARIKADEADLEGAERVCRESFSEVSLSLAWDSAITDMLLSILEASGKDEEAEKVRQDYLRRVYASDPLVACAS